MIMGLGQHVLVTFCSTQLRFCWRTGRRLSRGALLRCLLTFWFGQAAVVLKFLGDPLQVSLCQ